MPATSTPPKASLTVDQAIQQAITLHQAGNLQGAEQLYLAILQAQPRHPDANHNLGVLAVQMRKPSVALPHFKAALEANPNQGQYWVSYIEALIQNGQQDAAQNVLEQGRQRGLQGASVEALVSFLNSLASLVALMNQCRYTEAETIARQITERSPGNGFGWKRLWEVQKLQGYTEESLAAIKKAVELLPEDAETHNNMGMTLKHLGRLDEAEAYYRRALEMKPDYVEAHSNLGNTLKDLGRITDAKASYCRALEIMPDSAEVHNNLGHLLMEQGRASEGLSHFRKALDAIPSLLSAQEGMCVALKRIVPEWHFPMMNEQKRNAAYFSSMKSAIISDSEVFEIGTGSGLLAMMAARLGARKVTTCEAEPLIAEAAQQIIVDNGYENVVSVLAKRSINVKIGEDLPEKADILVTEIFSSELLGEHVIPIIEDAKRRLLKPKARVIPAAGSIMIALFSGDDIRKNLIVEDSFGFKLHHFNSIVSKKRYIARNDLNIEMLTEDIEAFHFDFQNDSFFPSQTKRLRIPITSPGLCYGIIQWIQLQMDKNTTFTNHPSEKSPVSNWHHCAYVFPEPVDVKPSQVAVISGSHDRTIPWFSLDGIESA